MPDLVQRLRALLPDLEYGQETHRQWRDCHQKYRDKNPDIGSAAYHDKMVRTYQERIDTVRETITELERRASEAGTPPPPALESAHGR